MRVLVLGSSGMLGTAVCHHLRGAGFDVVAKDRNSFDARNLDLDGLVPDGVEAVINASGMINRRLAQPEQDFLRVNCLFPRRLADWCEQRAVKLLHVSTDCVFKGDQGPYLETAPTNATDLYGMTKSWGEPRNAMVLRTSIIGPESHNHYSLLCWVMAQQGTVRGFLNHHWNGVTTLELARAMASILERGLWKPGVQHLYGEDVSKFELLNKINRVFELGLEVAPVDDAVARDTRLRTVNPAFLAQLAIEPMEKQLQQLRALTNRRGHWQVQP